MKNDENYDLKIDGVFLGALASGHFFNKVSSSRQVRFSRDSSVASSVSFFGSIGTSLLYRFSVQSPLGFNKFFDELLV